MIQTLAEEGRDRFELPKTAQEKFITLYNFALAKEDALPRVELSNIIGVFGSGGRDRTYDQLINSQLLYR